MPMSVARLTYGMTLLFCSCPQPVAVPQRSSLEPLLPAPITPTGPYYQVASLPTFEGKKEVYAVSESASGLNINLNIGGSHHWDFTTLPKSREAYKKISGGVPPRYESFFKDTKLTLESNIASTGRFAKYTSHVFYNQDNTAIETRGLASVQRIPVYGTKEVVGIYAAPFDKWVVFPLAVGNRWTDARGVRMKLIDPDASKVSMAALSCSVYSERDVPDEGDIVLNFEGIRKTYKCLVMHERVDVSCSNGSKVGHTYYWINGDLGFVAYIAGMENNDTPTFDRAAGIASLLRIESVLPSKEMKTKRKTQSRNQ
jgi:hypothetical protein